MQPMYRSTFKNIQDAENCMINEVFYIVQTYSIYIFGMGYDNDSDNIMTIGDDYIKKYI